MKKIGIITIQKSPASYGGNLQAYALWSYLTYKGYVTEIIDLYRPVHSNYYHSVNSLKFSTYSNNKNKFSLLSLIRKIFSYLSFKKIKEFRKENAFAEFSKKVTYSKPFKSVDELYNNPPIYDLYISGSDQIWNPDMNFELEPYFLTFSKGGQCISYASSFGKENISYELKEKIKEWLNSYKSIAVREESGAKMIRESFKMKCEVVLDPTFLVEKSKWEEIMQISTISTRYLFYFMLTFDVDLFKKAKDLARTFGLKFVTNHKPISKQKENCECISDVSIEEWLGHIHGAELIMTDSFHATVFSVIYNIEFYSLISDDKISFTRSNRIFNILDKLSLSDRLLNSSTFENSFKFAVNRIDFVAINHLLEKERLKSEEYLLNAIESEV